MAVPWLRIAGTIYQMGKVLVTGKELTEQVNVLLKERKRALENHESIAARMPQLEEALAKQAEVHRQLQIQMEMLSSDLDDIQKSMRSFVVVASIAMLLAVAALLVAVLK